MKNAASCWGASLGVLLLLTACDAGSEATAPAQEPPPEPAPPLDVPAQATVLQPLFDGQVSRAEHVAPVVGGTLLVTRNGQTIVAADPDRDALFLVDATSHAVTLLSLQSGDEPGRLVEGSGGTVYVALRRAGALLAIDSVGRQVIERVPVCASPRGLAYDEAKQQIVVACRSGQLVTFDARSLAKLRTLQLEPDLRDVIVREHDLVVTRFLSAELMVVAEDGSISRRATPSPQPNCAEATVAFRALALPSGAIVVGHQLSSSETASESSGGYGFSCGTALVTRELSLVDVDHGSMLALPSDMPEADAASLLPSSMTFQSTNLLGAGPLDIAFDSQSQRAATIALDDRLVGSNFEPTPSGDLFRASLWLTPWDGKSLPHFMPGENPLLQGVLVPGQPVAVAFDAAGHYVVQSREPATLEFEGGASVRLSSDSRADSGATMFYMNSGIGISCSSCHPEGGEDGHVWHFSEGFRRTLPLQGGVLERAPFHWDGTLGDMSALTKEVMMKRMALPKAPTDAQISALGAFLEQLPALPSAEGLDAASVQRGKALFERPDVACASCHSGAEYTDNQLNDVGTGGKFVTPSLLGVGLRTQLFHDGCASDLEQRFGICGGSAHGKPELLSVDERADLIAFMRSL